jgi:hypothetical protein
MYGLRMEFTSLSRVGMSRSRVNGLPSGFGNSKAPSIGQRWKQTMQLTHGSGLSRTRPIFSFEISTAGFNAPLGQDSAHRRHFLFQATQPPKTGFITGVEMFLKSNVISNKLTARVGQTSTHIEQRRQRDVKSAGGRAPGGRT